MATTYKLISSVTVGSGGASSIAFTSIPATYTDLLIKISMRCAGGQQWSKLEFNGTSYLTNWKMQYLQGDGTSAASGNQADSYYSIMMPGSGQTASTFGSAEVYIPNYRSSNNKPVSIDHVTENNAVGAFANLTALLWSNSAAITSITISESSGSSNYAQYSTASLYGISNA
jgi:hypothetical protein